ncbi:MAG: hypothetical protein GC162_02925 [Planctomycetes bacterium]|nr:hypothetical protein [Planctomycetota bacterium]
MDKWFDQFEHAMTLLFAEHEQLLLLVKRKQEAMRLAKPQLVTDCCAHENERVQKIAELEKRRQQVLGLLTQKLAPQSTKPMTLSEVAEHAGEPRRGRLLVMHRKLRALIEQIRRENDIARRATEGLLRHVTGVMQMVTAAVGGSGTYGRRGMSGAHATVVSSFSLTA